MIHEVSFLVYFMLDTLWDQNSMQNKWYFVTKIVLTYCEKKLTQARTATEMDGTLHTDFENLYNF